jgi:heme A synthase
MSGGTAPRLAGQRSTLAIVLPTGFAFLVLGVSGAITALGDTLFPAKSLADGLAQDLSPTAHVFLRLRLWHPIIALTTALLVTLSAGLLANRARRAAIALGVLFVAQLFAGLLNVVLLAPISLQMIHLALADGVWISFVLLTVSALAKEPDSVANPTPAPAA